MKMPPFTKRERYINTSALTKINDKPLYRVDTMVENPLSNYHNVFFFYHRYDVTYIKKNDSAIDNDKYT